MGNSSGKEIGNSGPVTTAMIKDIWLQRIIVPDTKSSEKPNTSNLTTVAEFRDRFPSGDIWKDQPAIVYVIRRPGCPLCREHAMDLNEKQPEFAAKGVKLVGVVHEKLGVEEFSTGFFERGELFFDEEKAFFNSLGMRWESLTALVKPSVIQNVSRVRARGVEGNLKGEGRLLGGLLVVGAGDSGVKFEHREAVFGDHASMDDIMAAVKALTGTDK